MDIRPKLDIRGAFTGYEEGDLPLLEELGINFSVIKEECIKIYSFKYPGILHNYDLTGPLVFVLIFSICLLHTGKVLFGCIYFICIIDSMIAHFFVNMMCSDNVDLLFICSIIGYSMLPIIGFSIIQAFSVNFLKMNQSIILLTGCLCAFFSAYVSNKYFIFHIKKQELEMFLLYPLFLLFMSFVVLTLY